jgi:hypothetical protein
MAQWSPPPSEPANNAFFRLRASGRMARSTMLESISTCPSSMKRQRPSHRDSAYRIASATALFWETRTSLVSNQALRVSTIGWEIGRPDAHRRVCRASRPRWHKAPRCAQAPRSRSAQRQRRRSHRSGDGREPSRMPVVRGPSRRECDSQRSHRPAECRGSLRGGLLGVGLAVRRINIGDGRRRRPAPRSIIASIGPELTRLGPTSARIKHGGRGLVGKELG